MRKIPFDDKIQNSRIRLVGQDRDLIGDFEKTEAIEKAHDANMNLIQIAAIEDNGEKISICIIQDYNKYMYSYNRSHKKHKINNKEITIGSNIDMKDMMRKLDYVCEITEKDNIPVTLVLTRRRRVEYASIEQFIKSYFISKDTHNVKIIRQTDRAVRFYITRKKK